MIKVGYISGDWAVLALVSGGTVLAQCRCGFIARLPESRLTTNPIQSCGCHLYRLLDRTQYIAPELPWKVRKTIAALERANARFVTRLEPTPENAVKLLRSLKAPVYPKTWNLIKCNIAIYGVRWRIAKRPQVLARLGRLLLVRWGTKRVVYVCDHCRRKRVMTIEQAQVAADLPGIYRYNLCETPGCAFVAKYKRLRENLGSSWPSRWWRYHPVYRLAGLADVLPQLP
jgi:hypothetical protein